MFPRSLNINPPLDDVTVEIINASGVSTINITSVLNVTDVLVLNRASLHCADVQIESNTLLIGVDTLRKLFLHRIVTKTDVTYVHLFLATPPSPSSTSCSILPSPGGAEAFLQWSPSFTSQHAVERYRVSVAPDPSSCSSDQVSPNEDYSCSGLVLGTPYTFTISAINCGNQEGNRMNFSFTLLGTTLYQ